MPRCQVSLCPPLLWCHGVQSRDVSSHNFDDLAMSGLAFSVAPTCQDVGFWQNARPMVVKMLATCCRIVGFSSVGDVGLQHFVFVLVVRLDYGD